MNIRLSNRRLLIPDLVIITCPGEDFGYVSADGVRLAAEIESPSCKVADRVLKRQSYAEAGIELRDGEYHEITRSAAGRLTLTRPFAADVDLAV